MLAQREWKASLDTAGNTEIATLPISSSKVAPKPPPLHNNHTTKAGKCFLKSQFETYRWNGHRCGLGTFKWRWSTPQHFAIREYINVASIYHNAWKDSFSACLTILNYFSHMKWPSKSSSKVICFSLNSFVTFCLFELEWKEKNG